MSRTSLTEQVLPLLEGCPIGTYPRNAVLFVEDQPAETLFILVEGLVKISFLGRSGREKTLQYILPGATFGVVSLLEGRDYGVMATTMMRSRVALVPKAEVYYRLRTLPAFSEFLVAELADKVRSTSRRAARFSMHNRIRKVVSGLIDLIDERSDVRDLSSEVTVKVTHQELADFAGTNRVTVTNVLGFLEDRGLVQRQAKAVRIPDPEALLSWPDTPRSNRGR